MRASEAVANGSRDHFGPNRAIEASEARKKLLRLDAAAAWMW